MSIPGPDSQIPPTVEQVPPPYAAGQGAPAWPPPPSQSPGAWPPAAYGAPPALFQMPFTHIVGRTHQGPPSDLRVGTMWVTGDGLMFAGKAVMPAETRVPIVAVLFILLRLAGLIAMAVLEYAFRKDQQLFVPWSQVQKIIFNKKRNQALFVFDAPNFSRGTIKKFSLVTNIPPLQFDAFAAAVHPFVPDRFAEGNIDGIPFWLRVLLIVLILAIVFAVIYVALNTH